MTSSPARTASSARGVRALILVALAGLAAFLLALGAVALGGRLAPLDGQGLAVADELARALPAGAVRLVTALGAFPTTAAVVAAAALALVARGRARAAVALVVGFLAIAVTVQLVKAGVARPRPPGYDRALTNASFPSAHAAHSTAWTAVALALTRGRDAAAAGARARRAVVVGALVVTLAVGATRPLLDAHFLSDVVGGWGLGAALFALTGALALAIGPMRHTTRADGERSARERTETTA